MPVLPPQFVMVPLPDPRLVAARGRSTTLGLARTGLITGLVSLIVQLAALLVFLGLSQIESAGSSGVENMLTAMAAFAMLSLLSMPMVIPAMWMTSFGLTLAALIRVGDGQRAPGLPPWTGAGSVMAGALVVSVLQGAPALCLTVAGVSFLEGLNSTGSRLAESVSRSGAEGGTAVASMIVGTLIGTALIVAHGMLLARLRALGQAPGGPAAAGAHPPAQAAAL